MPQINGFELCEKIKKIDSEVKACFITAHEVYRESLREIFHTMDLDCYVKPIGIEDLVTNVKAELASNRILEPPKNLFCDGILSNKVQQKIWNRFYSVQQEQSVC
jgi:two-component SAPR family response regulator